jgi:glycerate-2-kinase
MRILNAETLTSHGNVAGRKAVVEILEAGLQAADPYYTTARMMRVEGNRLIVGCGDFEPFGDPKAGQPEVFDLDRIDRIFVFGASKGIQRVARAVEEILGDKLTGGHVIAKHDDEPLCERIGVTYGAHPVPDEGCVAGCRRIVESAREAHLTERDLVFTIGGSGISSLLTLPADGITLEEVRQLTYLMQIEKGVPTYDLNQVRNHIDALKGGQISRYFRPARVVHLVPKEPISYERFLGGTHFVHFFPDRSSFADAIAVLKRWQAWDEVPASIRAHLTKADPAAETMKSDEFAATNAWIFCVLPGATGMLPSAEAKARELGYTPYRLASAIQAEAGQAGLVIADLALNVVKEGQPFQAPCAIISGGELIVTVGKETGMGGRNQEYCLATALRIAGNRRIVVGAVDSDATDGPGGQFVAGGVSIPCLAGGVVDGQTLADARAAGIDLHESLRRHDTSPALWMLKSGVLATHSISLLDLRVTLITA